MWRVKVCGLTKWSDAVASANEEADACGWIFEPSSPRFVGAKPWYLIRSLGGVSMVGVMGEYRAGLSVDILRLIQIVQAFGCDQRIGKSWMPVFRPRTDMEVEEWLAETRGWDWCLLDPFHAGMAGGTGETVNWELAARFVEEFSGKVILAGGLGPENVRQAIRVVKPFGVDASSRLEVSPGVKDLDKVGEYVREAWAGLIEVHGRSQQDLWDEAAVFRNGW
ncbi:hypothetical protein C0431_00475 [bacterium]|nr:hypothetical protein [bacterium]